MKKFFLLVSTIIIIYIICIFSSCDYKPKPVDGSFTFNKVPFITLIIKGKPEIFILDTGASISVLDKKYADDNGIYYSDDGSTMITFSGEETVQYKTDYNVEFVISGIMYSQKFMVQDIGKLRSLVGNKVRGVLGSDFLYFNKIIIDYGELTIKNNKINENI